MDTIALVGNPNSGKTTLFNALTGSNQYVGNWPGVTVEKKEGIIKFNKKDYSIVDLPGTYSLGAFSEDEIIARDYILKGNPKVVINVIDATNIERNLYLTTQLLEMGVKVIIALNMIDEAETRKIRFDIETLSKRLGVPIIPTIASKKKGLSSLIVKTVELINKKTEIRPIISYGKDIDIELKNIKSFLKNNKLGYPSQWIAIKILEGDKYIYELINNNNLLNSSSELKNTINRIKGNSDHYELEIINKRYEFVNKLTKDTVIRPKNEVVTITDKIDKVLTNKYWGIPIFVIIMFIMFQLTFSIGEDLLGGIFERFVEVIAEFVTSMLVIVNAPNWLISFTAEGIFGGVGAVVEFVPLIVVLYGLMGFLEDSGYMARAAYLMDDIMRALGLQGKAFISMIVGFGCNVPGVMSTRTLENKKDRMIAILTNSFMSCGAKIPIYLVFIAAFFPNRGGIVLFSLYFTGIAIGLIVSKVFNKTLFKGETSYFIMELPPYRIPTIRNVLRNMWDNVSGFLVRAGTTIFAVVSILWVLSVLPVGVEPHSKNSILGIIGTFIAPIFKPAGFGTWQAAVGLFSGIAAKEAVVATLGMVYAGVEDGAELIKVMQGVFTPLSAMSFMLTTLLYTPCAATLATIKKETGSYKWAVFSAVYTFLIGWIIAVLVYQIGKLVGLN